MKKFKIDGKEIDFNSRTHLMGVVNVTPDSFSDGGKFYDTTSAVDHALRLIEDGADIIDIGGESTRPRGMYGETSRISAEEESSRVLPVIELLRKKSNALVSIDTYKSSVADRALSSGAHIVNDISGLRFDNDMAAVASKHRATVVVMHIQGTPETMQIDPQYVNVVKEVCEGLALSVQKAEEAGIEQIIVDPGIGFGKKLEHNLALLKHLADLNKLGYPILVGPSRKAFIGTLLDLPVDQRHEGTGAAVAAAILNGAHLIRVHDVKEMKRVATIIDAIKKA